MASNASRLAEGIAFADAMRAGEPIATGWSAIPAPMNASAMARGGFRAVCVDMQHGYHSEDSMMSALQGVHQADGSPGLRIPVGRFDLASRALDAGAQFVIAPMINTVQDAKALVEATKYPPVGGRSWGPSAALDLWGADMATYLADANRLTLSIAMIETVTAQSNLEDILAVDGLDGVFVGPSDLSITLSQGARIEAGAAHVLDAAKAIGQAARDAGKIAGVYAFDVDKARAFVDMGFSFVAVGSDLMALKAAAAKGHAIG